MFRKLLPLLLALLTATVYVNAQNKKTATLKGRLVNNVTNAPFADLKVSIPQLAVFTSSDGAGKFELSETPQGAYLMLISGPGAKTDSINVAINDVAVDMGDIKITPDDATAESADIPTIPIATADVSASDNGDNASVGGEELLLSGRDPFVSTAAFVFGYYMFKPRGNRNQNQSSVNGISINNAQTGYLSWTQHLGNQNDVFRGRDIRYGLEPSPYTFGGVNGSTYIEATAANNRKETKVTYTSNNTNVNKIMFTTSSGIMKNGWAYTLSANRQWNQEGYRPGTFMDGYAYYAGVSKTMKKGIMNLTSFGVPMRQARGRMATQEAMNLAKDNYYNPDWGYQTDNKGKVEKRSGSIQNVFQPTTILNYEHRPNDRTRWNTAVGYQFGKEKQGEIDWYNASSPFGNYYKNLPSYYLNFTPPDTATANQVTREIQNDPAKMQVDWNRLYNANLVNNETIRNVGGIQGNNVTGKRSVYVLSDKVNDLKKFTFNTNIERSLNAHLSVFGGLTITSQYTRSYKQLTDLLGGDFFVNYNQFAALQYVANPIYNQNNLSNPNAVIRKGDKYGYDYSLLQNNSLAWGQVVGSYNRFGFFAALEGGNNSFSREGFMRNGLFANNSLGKSATYSFFNYAGKGGINYKLNRHSFLYASAAYIVSAPTATNTFIAAETRDYTVNNPTVQSSQTLEGGYLLKSGKVNARVVGYVTDVKNATEIKRFYNDDPAYQTFVNFAMQHQDTRSLGVELMGSYKLTRYLTVKGVAAIGQSFYTNNPDISIYVDNDTTQHAIASKSYIKNYYLPTGPQTAYSVELNYHSQNYWFANINFNYFDRNYVEVNPARRTQPAADLIARNSTKWNQIYDQEKLPSAFVTDFYAGKSFQLSRMSKLVKKTTGGNTVLAVSFGIKNLLNNTNVLLRGREQFRYDFVNRNPDKFPATYQYAFGINYYLNISLRF